MVCWLRTRSAGRATALAISASCLFFAAAAAEEPLSKQVPGLWSPANRKAAEEASVFVDDEGRARTSMFGAVGIGHKFVYVIDRSTSMAADHQKPLKAVKAELLRSLKNLDTVHQFQIVYYNERPSVFNPSGMAGKLAFATEANKDRAARFVESITADGNTRHDDALKLAIRLRPDVIFFLTDGDDPKLTRRELDRIEHLADGIAINAIEFGRGPKPEQESFLATLAKENDGHYVYIDLLKDLPKPSEQRDRQPEIRDAK